MDHAGWTTRRPADRAVAGPRESDLLFELRLAPSGQVGWFPEQAANRRWIAIASPRCQTQVAASDPPTLVSRRRRAQPLRLHGRQHARGRGGRRTRHARGRGTDRRSRGRAGTRNSTASPTGRSAGSPTTRWCSPGASDGAAGATRGSSSTRRATDTARVGTTGASSATSPPLLAQCGELLADAPRAFVTLTAHTPGRRGELLADWLAAAVGPGDVGDPIEARALCSVHWARLAPLGATAGPGSGS